MGVRRGLADTRPVRGPPFAPASASPSDPESSLRGISACGQNAAAGQIGQFICSPLSPAGSPLFAAEARLPGERKHGAGPGAGPNPRWSPEGGRGARAHVLLVHEDLEPLHLLLEHGAPQPLRREVPQGVLHHGLGLAAAGGGRLAGAVRGGLAVAVGRGILRGERWTATFLERKGCKGEAPRVLG